MRISDWSSDVCSSDLVLAKALAGEKWLAEGRGKTFYAVGGSWRALAQVHMDVTDHPLPMVHQYPLPRQALPQLVRSLAQMGTKRLKQVANLSGSRIQTLPGAAALLSATVRKLGASQRSEGHTYELQSLTRIAFAVLC